MKNTQAQLSGPAGLLIYPQPYQGESWGGYLLRLAGVNACRGMKDLGSFLGLTVVNLLKAEPAVITAKLGIGTAPSSCKSLSVGRRSKLSFAGRSMTFRFCPHCLDSDADPYIRADWDGPISLTCPHHGVLLISRCQKCGTAPTYRQRSHLVCQCGASYRSQIPHAIPGYIADFEMVFREAMRSGSKSTFAGSTELERQVSAVVHWLMEPLDAKTGQRKRNSHQKSKPLDIETVKAIAPFLDTWPRRAVQLVRMEYEKAAKVPVWFLKRRLCTNQFSQMSGLIKALEDSLRAEHKIWLEANRETLIDPQKSSFSLGDLESLTGIEYQQLHKLCISGRIPESRQRQAKACRYHGLEVPAHVYWSIANAYRHTNSCRDAALQVGCSEHAIQGVVKSECVRSFALTPSMSHRRICPETIAKLAIYLFRLAKVNTVIPEKERVYFSKWVDGPYSWTTAKKWKKVLTVVRAEQVPLHSSIKDPIALDQLFLTKNDWRRALNRNLMKA